MSVVAYRYLCQLTGLTLLASGGVGGLFFYLCPQYWFGGYFLISALFFLFGLMSLALMEMGGHHSPARKAQFYLLSRGLRMILSLVAMGLYCYVVSENRPAFLLAFVANYFIYLVFDTWFYYKNEFCSMKKEKEILKHE